VFTPTKTNNHGCAPNAVTTPTPDFPPNFEFTEIVPGKHMTPETKFSHLHHIFESKKPPPEVERWTAEDEERLQNLRGKEISMEDTAVGRKKLCWNNS
jgi:hypothetical protein